MRFLPAPAAIAGRVLAVVAIGVAGAVAGADPALADPALPAPGTPVATNVTTTSVTLSWSAPDGPVADYTIQLITGRDPWHDLDTTSATTYTHTGLPPDTTHIYRVIANPVPGSGHTASEPSGHLYALTDPLPESEPPTAPTTVFGTRISPISATIHAQGATDNHRIAGYWVQRQVDGVWTDWATNNISTIYLPDLTPDTAYTVVVVAFDPNGNRSPHSPPFSFTTPPAEPLPGCEADLTVFGQQYIFSVSVENMTIATMLEDWTVTFTMPAEHVVTGTNSTITRDGDLATATPPSWATPIHPGGTASIWALASYPIGSPLPSGFTLHGSAGTIPCA